MPRGTVFLLVIVGGLVFGVGAGGLVHEAITRLAPPHQSANAEGLYGAVMGLGIALMLIASWLRGTK